MSLTSSLAQQRGKATFYSSRLHGTRMSDGSRYHKDSMICAHKKYPLGTLLKVTNPKNGKSVVVRGADRGPYGRGLIIDLSYSAAKEIGIVSSGIAMVEVEEYRNISVPFKPNDDIEIPELDLETTHSANSFQSEWKEK